MDVERTLEFILENQAKFSAQMGELESLVGRIAQQQLDLGQHVDRFQRGVSDAVMALAEAQRHLAEEQQRLAETQRHLAEEQQRLTEAQRHTEERLNALISIVDGLIPRHPAE